MSQFILDFFFAFIFVLILALLMRIRDKTFADNRESYKYAVSGISVLFLVSLIRLVGNQGLFGQIPFLSEPIYRELAEAIGIVAGIALMIAGVSIWLPARKRQNISASTDNEIGPAIQRVEKEILEAGNVTRLFATVPELICNAFGYESSALFRWSGGSRSLVCVHRHNISPALSEKLDNEKIKIGDDPIDPDVAAKVLNASHHFVVKVKGQARAALFFWDDKREGLSNFEKMALDGIARLLSIRLNSYLLERKHQFHEGNRDYVERIKGLVSRRADIRENLHDLHQVFKHAVGCDYMSLAVSDGTGKSMKTYTAGINRRVLLADGGKMQVEDTHVGKVAFDERSLIISDVSATTDPRIDSLFLSCGQSSLIAVPIKNHGRIIGILTLGHAMAGHFKNRDLVRVEAMATALAPAIESEIARDTIYERDRYLGSLSAFDSLVESEADVDSILNSAADVIMENVGTTMVRIGLLSDGRNKFFTRALKTIRPLDTVSAEETLISREMTPWHQMVMQENRLLLINQDDPQSSMDKNECRALVFEGMRSALIVPIVVSGFTQGFVTLGEMRQWDRFSYDSATILFCRQMAAKVAGAIGMYKLGRALAKFKETAAGQERTVFDREGLLRELKSPITHIRGSIDLLKLKQVSHGPMSRKVLTNM
ncbi:MAG: GAF domain-containing protein, partial [Candidatus Zixiibacteriota bacterium]